MPSSLSRRSEDDFDEPPPPPNLNWRGDHSFFLINVKTLGKVVQSVLHHIRKQLAPSRPPSAPSRPPKRIFERLRRRRFSTADQAPPKRHRIAISEPGVLQSTLYHIQPSFWTFSTAKCPVETLKVAAFERPPKTPIARHINEDEGALKKKSPQEAQNFRDGTQGTRAVPHSI